MISGRGSNMQAIVKNCLFGNLQNSCEVIEVFSNNADAPGLEIAKDFGISEWIIGIIMISLGTSLPELVVSISAATRGKVDMAIGNIIGSNMANTTVVLGAAALTSPMAINASAYIFDIATMIVATLLLVFITANKLYNKSAGISLIIILGLFLNNTIQSM